MPPPFFREQVFRSRYAMVTSSSVRYSTCFEVGVVNETILNDLGKDLKTPEEFDHALAKELIEQRLAPVLKAANASLAF